MDAAQASRRVRTIRNHLPITKEPAMKSQLIKSAVVVAAVAAMFGSTGARASDSVSVTVNATIVGVCKFFTSSPVVNITNTGTGSNIDGCRSRYSRG